jgi:anti-sigma regulatory factor (Ser/Thr protein kinase)
MYRSGEKSRQFILDAILEHPQDIVRYASSGLGLSRQGILWHLKKLANEGLIQVEGKTKGRRYSLKNTIQETVVLDLTPELKEDLIWKDSVASHFKDLPENVYRILHYVFTEMMNNAIDHSGGGHVVIVLARNARVIEIVIQDDGIGIFKKIYQDRELIDERHAIIELQKGKLTTDSENHSGEGIFFTSRAVDEFQILSRGLNFRHKTRSDDWLIEMDEQMISGTSVLLRIDPGSDRTLANVFDMFTAEEAETPGFSSTHVPLKLSEHDGDLLVSRSQAKRLLARFQEFDEVSLDFKDIDSIGQAFADQIFRVFKRDNPDVRILYLGANAEVEMMIKRALFRARTEEGPAHQEP